MPHLVHTTVISYLDCLFRLDFLRVRKLGGGGWSSYCPQILASQTALSFSASQGTTNLDLSATVAVVSGVLAGLCGWAPDLLASSFLRPNPQALVL